MSRGHDRERAVKKLLEAEGWFVIRAAASLGFADLVALKRGRVPLMLEIKSTTDGPYKHFSPQDRDALTRAADAAGAEAFLVWWPPRKQPVWISQGEWPEARRAA